MYKLIRPILFLIPAEATHHLVMKGLKLFARLPFGKTILKSLFCIEDERMKTEVMGITFPNKVALAAGFDKNALYIDELALLGFGCIEIGTVTPKPQPGNDQPRLFRLPKDQALINRMGFNNDGVDVVVERLKKIKNKTVIIGGNIGKNKSTPQEEAVIDYKIGFEKLYDHCHYFVVNVSSPNTPGLRALQDKESLSQILDALILIRKQFILEEKAFKPIVLKIAPDLTTTQLDEVMEVVNESGIDGIIATNTTIDRSNLRSDKTEVESIGAGGLSGAPLTKRSTDVLEYLQKINTKKLPLIASGGVMNAEDALDKFKAGSSLVQVYTGFIYEGPFLIKQILKKESGQ